MATQNIKKDIATSLTTFIFLVIGITGIMMFFHIFDKYTKDLHEILGLAFIAVVIFHVIFNFKQMKQYFSKKVFLGSAVLVSLISLGFILNTPEGDSTKKIIVGSIFNSHIDKTFVLFTDDISLAKQKLEKAGIKVGEATTIKKIAKANKTSPFKIIKVLSN